MRWHLPANASAQPRIRFHARRSCVEHRVAGVLDCAESIIDRSGRIVLRQVRAQRGAIRGELLLLRVHVGLDLVDALGKARLQVLPLRLRFLVCGGCIELNLMLQLLHRGARLIQMRVELLLRFRPCCRECVFDALCSP